MNASKPHWILVTFAAAAAALGAGAPPAGADPWWNGQQVSITRPDDRSGVRGPGAAQSATATELMVRPDDRPGPQGPGTVSDERRVILKSLTDTFDWLDAGIGAAFVLGLFIIGGGALLALRHRKDTIAAA